MVSLLSVRALTVVCACVVLFGCATVDDMKMDRLKKWQAISKPLRDSGELSQLDYDKQELEIVRSQPMNHLWRIWAKRLTSQIEIRTAYLNGKISRDEANLRLKKAAEEAIDKYEEDERLQAQRTIDRTTPIYLPSQPTTTNCVRIGNSVNCISH